MNCSSSRCSRHCDAALLPPSRDPALTSIPNELHAVFWMGAGRCDEAGAAIWPPDGGRDGYRMLAAPSFCCTQERDWPSPCSALNDAHRSAQSDPSLHRPLSRVPLCPASARVRARARAARGSEKQAAAASACVLNARARARAFLSCVSFDSRSRPPAQQ